MTDTTPNITYQVLDYKESDTAVEVKYTRNSDGFIHSRRVNIPHLEDGSIDEAYFQEILSGQLLGVINKYRAGIIEFVDPSTCSVPVEPLTP